MSKREQQENSGATHRIARKALSLNPYNSTFIVLQELI
jgi:hypothetical protein